MVGRAEGGVGGRAGGGGGSGEGIVESVSKQAIISVF